MVDAFWSIIFLILSVFFIGVIYLSIVTVVKLTKGYLRYQVTNKPQFAACPKLPGKFPLLQMFEPDAFKKYLARIFDEEGNLIHKIIFIGPHIDGTATLFINDSNYFKELLTEEKFPKLELFYDGLKFIIGEGLVTSKGPTWKRQRRLLTPIFHFQSLKQMPSIMIKNVKEFCAMLKDQDGKEMMATQTFGELTLAIVINCVFGGEEFLPTHRLTHLWELTTKNFGNYFLAVMLLGTNLANVLPIPTSRTLLKSLSEIKGYVANSIAKKRIQITAGNYQEDLLSALLTVVDKETGEAIPDSLIQDECLTFLFAGHDTTSSLLSWTVSFLAKNPEVVVKMREEIGNVLGGNEYPEFEDLNKFHYCKNVLQETLRMRPPVASLDRRTAEPFTVEGIDIPVGTYVAPVMLAAHYDNRYWKNPFEFRPERWDPENAETEPARHPFCFVPFSAGTRNCIGQKFAMMEATLVIVVLVSKFDIVSSQKLDEIVWDIEGTMKPVNFKCSFIPVEN